MPNIIARAIRFCFPGGVHVLKSVVVVLTANVVLAAVAFLKDIAYAAYFGTTKEADVFALAFFIPDTLGGNFVAAALGVVCVPLFAKAFAHKDAQQLRDVFRHTIKTTVFCTSGVAFVLAVSGNTLFHFIAPEWSGSDWSMGRQLLLLMAPLLLLLPLTTVFCALLQSVGRFSAAAYSPVWLNTVWLIGAVALSVLRIPRHEGVFLLAGSILLGSCLAAGGLFVPLKHAFAVLPCERGSIDGVDGEGKSTRPVRVLWKDFIPYLLFLAGAQIILAAERIFAAGLPPGTLSGLQYAYRLSQFPNWVFMAAVLTVYLPEMSKHFALGQQEELRRKLRHALVLAWAVSVPVSATLFLFRGPIIRLLFERGAFDANSIAITSAILAGYALAIPGQVTMAVCLRYALVIGQPWRFVIICLGSAGLTVLLDWKLIQTIGPAGLGYGAAIGFSLCASLLICLVAVQRRLQRKVVSYGKDACDHSVL